MSVTRSRAWEASFLGLLVWGGATARPRLIALLFLILTTSEWPNAICIMRYGSCQLPIPEYTEGGPGGPSAIIMGQTGSVGWRFERGLSPSGAASQFPPVVQPESGKYTVADTVANCRVNHRAALRETSQKKVCSLALRPSVHLGTSCTFNFF